MAKILLISFLFFFLTPYFVQAALVPCGPGIAGNETCEFCDFFVMTNNIINEMFKLVGVIAVLMLIIGGMAFFWAGAKPEALKQAKGIITSVVIGLLIIFSAWVIVNTVFEKSGIINMPSGWSWYNIECETQPR